MEIKVVIGKNANIFLALDSMRILAISNKLEEVENVHKTDFELRKKLTEEANSGYRRKGSNIAIHYYHNS